MQAGTVTCACSEDDGIPDVGVLIGLGNGKALWLGELLERECAGNVGFRFYGAEGGPVVAAMDDWQDVADMLRHHVAPAVGQLARQEALTRMVAMDEAMEAEHPGWMTDAALAPAADGGARE